MSPNHSDPSIHEAYYRNLGKLDLTLPQGISRQDSFTATGRLGTFTESNIGDIAEALERRDFLTRAEEVAFMLGSPNEAQTARFLPRGACLRHSPNQIGGYLAKLQELNRDFGESELRRAGIISISTGEIKAASELLDYVALLPRLRHLSGSVYLALLHRAACIDPATNEEWPTIELAQASRTIETNPIAQGNLPLWERITTADTVPCPDVVRRITLRWMSDPDVHEPI